MTLKFKLQHKLTAVVKIIDDTSAIFSDEIGTDLSQCLQTVVGKDKQDLWNNIVTLANKQQSKFDTKIAVVTDDKCIIINLKTGKKQELSIKPQPKENISNPIF